MSTNFKARLLAASLLCSLLLVLIAAASAIRVRFQAEAFLKKVQELQPGKTGSDQVDELVHEYGGHLESCISPNCEAYFDFRNTALHLFRLAPEQAFTGWLKVQDGKLACIRVRFYSAPDKTSIYAQVLEIAQKESNQKAYSAQLQYDNSTGEAWRALVKLTPEATRDQRVAAYDFDLSCLNSVGGCRNARQMLPRVWDGDPKPKT